MTAYFIWMNEVGRPAYTKAHPDADIGTIGKALGEEWKGMSDKAKKPFQEKADKAKKKYHTALEKYQKTASYKENESSKRKRLEGKSEPAAKKPKAPKRAGS